MTPAIKKILKPFQEKIEQALKEHAPSVFGEKSPLQEACVYAVSQGGKRLRPALVFMTAKALKKNLDVTEAALAIEYFHTASLIADDLPCMDNDAMRRGTPSTHVVYGEATALLASYALIAAGYMGIAINTEVLRKANVEEANLIGNLALKHAAHNAGVLGATGGQYLDLNPPKEDIDTYIETVIKKTVSLFELTMLFGWLFGGGEIEHINKVQEAAYHFGMAYQIADDIDDADEDFQEKRKMNVVTLLGLKASLEMFYKEVKAYLHCLEILKIDSPELKGLAEYLVETIKKKETTLVS